MKSVLNERSFLGDLLDVNMREKNRKDQKYLGGSITRFSKNLVMTFPVLCDSSVPIETAISISKANERNIADMLQMLFASMSLDIFRGGNAAEIIKGIYNDLDPNMDINELIDLLDAVAKNGGYDTSNYRSAARFEEAAIIKEMMEELKKIKPFPYDNFNERSLNEYTVKQVYNSIVVTEVSDPYKDASSESDSYVGEKPGYRYEPAMVKDKHGRETPVKGADNKTVYKYVSVYDTVMKNKNSKSSDLISAQAHKDQNIKDENRAERDRMNDMNKRQMDLVNMNKNALTANDVKKANEMQPLLLNINYNVLSDDGKQIIDKRTFLAGVKSRLIPVDGIDMVERFANKNRSKLSLKNLIRSTTGEISFVKDFILALDQVKLDAKNAAKRGPMANVWHILEKRSSKNNYNKIKAKGNDASCITSIVISQENVNYMKTAYKFDLEDINNAKLIMDSFNLLHIYIADEGTETVKYISDGNSFYETLSFASLDKDLSERNYRKMINMFNQQGR